MAKNKHRYYADNNHNNRHHDTPYSWTEHSRCHVCIICKFRHKFSRMMIVIEFHRKRQGLSVYSITHIRTCPLCFVVVQNSQQCLYNNFKYYCKNYIFYQRSVTQISFWHGSVRNYTYNSWNKNHRNSICYSHSYYFRKIKNCTNSLKSFYQLF